MTKPAIPIDRLWVLRPPYFFLAILLVGLMACQTEEVAVTPARSAQLTATPSANQLSPENITHLQPLARWGEGKAVAAQVAESRNWLAVATTIGVYVYQADTLQPIWFEPTAVTVEAVGFGANGRYLYALTHNRQTVQIWHSDSQTLAATIDSDVAIQEVIFLPDEQSVLVGTAAAVSRWQISPTPAQLFTITAANEQFGALSLMGADEFLSLATQAEGSHIQRRQLADGALVSRLAAPTALTLQAVKVSPDGRTIAATASPLADPFTTYLALWQAETGQFSGQLPVDFNASSPNWDFTADGQSLIVGNGRQQIEIWPVTLAARTAAFTLPTSSRLTAVQSLPQPNHFAVVLESEAIQIWDTNGELVAALPQSAANLIQAALTAEGQSLVAVGFSGLVSWWPLAAPQQVVQLRQHAQGEVNSVAFTADAARLALSTSEGLVQVRAVPDGVVQQSLNQKLGNVDTVAFSPDGRLLATGVGERLGPLAFDDTVTLWQLDDGSVWHEFVGEKEEVAGCSFFRNQVRFAPDGTLLAANSHDFTVELRDVATGALRHTFPPHLSSVLDIAFSPDGTLLATASDDATIRLWRLADYTLLHEVRGEIGGFWAMRFAPDGRSLAVSNFNGTISLLDVTSGQFSRTFSGTKNRVSNIDFSPDGRLLAAGGQDTFVSIWSVASGELIHQLAGHTGTVLSVAFAPDGTRLASGSRDNTVRLWQLTD